MQGEKENKIQRLCDAYVNWGVFLPVVALIFTILLSSIGVSMAAKAESAETKIKVDNSGSQISDLSDKFDKITEIKIRQ